MRNDMMMVHAADWLRRAGFAILAAEENAESALITVRKDGEVRFVTACTDRKSPILSMYEAETRASKLAPGAPFFRDRLLVPMNRTGSFRLVMDAEGPTSICFDAHCDTAAELWRQNQHLDRNSLNISLEHTEVFDSYLQFFAFCTVWMKNDGYRQVFKSMYDAFRKELDCCEDRVVLCTNMDNAARAVCEGKLGAFLSIEGAEAIGCCVSGLEEAYGMGVRMVTPVWNVPNALSGSCVTGEGLSAEGKEFCRRAQKLGMILDVSHISDRGFWDICELAERPVIASHSNSRRLCDVPRNLTDEMFLELCRTGGCAGINLYGNFLTDGSPSLDSVYAHLDHFLELGGPENVCLGGDLDGCDLLPGGISSCADYKKLGEYLKQKGYTDEVLKSVFYHSLWKVVETCIT